jgi:hypothetical protein
MREVVEARIRAMPVGYGGREVTNKHVQRWNAVRVDGGNYVVVTGVLMLSAVHGAPPVISSRLSVIATKHISGFSH